MGMGKGVTPLRRRAEAREKAVEDVRAGVGKGGETNKESGLRGGESRGGVAMLLETRVCPIPHLTPPRPQANRKSYSVPTSALVTTTTEKKKANSEEENHRCRPLARCHRLCTERVGEGGGSGAKGSTAPHSKQKAKAQHEVVTGQTAAERRKWAERGED